MSKIVILGTTRSGKTCYFYGMLRKMMVGIHGFSIRVEDKDYADIRMAVKRLNDISLPLAERFPDPSQMTQTYKLDLLYNLSHMEEFDWDDYPGELIESKLPEFIASMEGAHCLLLCVDGEGIQGSVDELDLLVENLTMDWGCFDLNNAVGHAEKVNENFPPICIMITKYDKISPELRNMDTISAIIKRCFPILFHPSGTSGNNRMVTICPVTLGKDFDQGARLNPKNVEMPICFATYLIQAAKVMSMREQAKELFQQNQDAWEQYHRSNKIIKLLRPTPQFLTEEQKAVIENILNNAEADLNALRAILEPFPLYLNGKEIAWE